MHINGVLTAEGAERLEDGIAFFILVLKLVLDLI
jgi:hypothetical protein